MSTENAYMMIAFIAMLLVLLVIAGIAIYGWLAAWVIAVMTLNSFIWMIVGAPVTARSMIKVGLIEGPKK